MAHATVASFTIGHGLAIGFALIVAAAPLATRAGIAAPSSASTTTPPLAMQAQSTRALRVTQAIVLDGRLDEAAWVQAPPIDRFYESFPRSQVAAAERTEVRLLYDDRFLYVGVRVWTHDPAALRKAFVRRDQVDSNQDYVSVYLDPQGSRRGSYVFRVNPRGSRTDGYENEARMNLTMDPDYNWDVATQIDARGWAAEIRIPLSTLRISRAGAQRWAVLVRRNQPRQQTVRMTSVPFPRQYSCLLCYAGTVDFADLRPAPQRFAATPGITITRRRDNGSFGTHRDVDVEPSLDAQWLVAKGAALDLTLNPDFSQVEADVAQLTANKRFALDLPEKRPFFREGVDLVNTPIPVVYTRSIAEPDYGLRYTQRSTGLEGTAFFARDGGRPAIIEPGFLGSTPAQPDFDSDDGFARLRDSLAHGSIGGLLASRRNDDGSRNLVAGIDATWSDPTDRVLGQLLTADTRNPNRPDLLPAWRGQSLQGLATLLQWDHAARDYWELRYQRYAPGFRSWLGYVPRVGYQALHGEYYRPYYLSSAWLNDIQPYVTWDRLQGIGGERGDESDPALGVVLDGDRNFSADVSWHPRATVLDSTGCERHTRHLDWKLGIGPGMRLPLVAFEGQLGHVVDYATGEVVPGSTLGWHVLSRPLDRLELEGRYDRTHLQGEHGQRRHLTETAIQWFATWHFTARMYALATWQRHTSARAVPATGGSRGTTAGLQFNWDVSRDLQLYWGARHGTQRSSGDSPGQGNEIYLKAAWTWRS